MKALFLTSLTAAALALPAIADTIEIDDDRWFRVDTPASNGVVVDIDDDGWTRMDAPLAQSTRSQPREPGICTQLERSARIATAECGTMTPAQLTFIQGD
ncbi:hypothetical protein ACK8OR_12875 [Jannaschia sp. KMU-145]|uniref:hypothetical protein n=1 Tax=Jannaschia halovivens TaxID=3388667 RepID=UPI00396B175C